MSGSKPVAVFLLLTLLIFKVTGLCAQTIQGFTPTNGGVGTTVTITGVGFNTSLAGNIVYFGAAKAVVTSANVNVLTVTVPAGATYQPITAVNTSTGTQGISKQPFDVTYNPTKSSIKPADFDSKVDFTTGSSPLSLSVCDVDGDGKPDIITSNGDKTISILKNTGAGGSITPASFAAGISLATGDNPLSITTGDINGDGKPDIVVVNSNTTVSVYKNLSTVGNISFAPKVDFVITNPTALKSVVISDIDGDLLPDLVFCSGGDVNILRNTSTGGNITFAAQKNFPANTSPTSYITVGDIDGDGKPDLAVTNKGNKTFSIFHNKSTAGTIKFDVRLDYSNIGEPDYVAESILLTDVDGDGKPEVLTVYTNYVNTALPSFVLISRYKGPGFANANFLYDSKFNSNHGYAQVRVADINGDGRPDIITLDPAGQVAIQSNISIPGSIAFLNAENLAAGSSPTAFEIADVNGDGKPDIITAHSPNAVAVIGNNPILNTPAITSFAPATVSAATTITIKGKNFTGATAVSFGNTPVTFTVISATEISAQVTTGTTGKVRVTTPLGIAERDGFKYVNPPNINYQTPQSYIINENITPLTPNNTGGAIPQTIYGETTVFAGSGGIGDNDGTGTAAQFKNPYGLTMDLEGNMYVTEVGASRLRKITPAGVVTTIAPDAVPGTLYGTGPAQKFGNLHGVVVDADGNVYVADYINALIRKITPDGTVTTLAGNINAGTQDGQGTAAGILRPSGMVIDGNGNIYFTDEHNRIRMVSPTGYVSTFVGSGLAKTQDGQYTTASFNVPVGLVIDKQGNLYVTEQTGRVIRKVTPNGVVTTFAGNGSYGYADGTGTAAVFGFLNGISIDASGNLLVTDQGYIRKITPAGVVATVAGGGPAGAITGTGKDVNFTQPTGVIVGPDGNLYVAENDNRIKKVIATGYTIDKTLPAGLVFDPKTGIISGTPTVLSPPTDYTITGYNKDGSSIKVVNIEVKQKDVVVPVLPPKISYLTPQVYEVNKTIAVLSPTNTGGPVGKGNFSTVTTLAGNLTAGAVNGLGSAASFNRPEGLTVDHSGNIYVADAANSLIRKITPGGNVSTFAGSGIASFADGTGTGAFFNNPADVVVDAAGNVYVADANNHRIRKITPAGVVTTIAGNSTVGNADGTGTAATFKLPSGIAIDVAGNLYVADSGNSLIRKISPLGGVTTLAGSGATGNTNGTGTAASFNGPIGIAVDAAGNVYVADSYNNLIRKITATGVVTTLAGSGAMGDADGTGTAASFKDPIGLEIDADGNLYATDVQNNKIRKITPAGAVTTVAGKTGFGTADGDTGTATFNTPFGIGIDADGNLYVGDTNNNTIRKIEADKFAIDKALPPGLAFDTHTGDITGTPTAPSPATDYTVTAYNTGGSSSTVVNIKVNQVTGPPTLPPKISYDSPKVYPPGTPIPPLTPHNTGGAVPQTAFGKAMVFAGNGSMGNTDNIGTDASFNFPTDVATDSKGNVFVADRDNSLIRKITPSGQVTTFAGSGVWQDVDGQGTAASFKGPANIAIDGDDNIYVTDTYADAVRKITPSGLVTTIVGQNGPGEIDGPVATAKIATPLGIAVGGSGNIYISEWDSGNIREITNQGVVKTIAGTGSPGYADGQGTAASFKHPQKIAIDASGNIFVADEGNNKVRGITPGGMVSTLIGDNIYYRFQGITGVTVDLLGNLYISDSGNGRIIKVEAITGKESILSDAAGVFNFPLGLTVDASGNLYVASPGSSTIVKVPTTGYTIDKPLPPGLTFDQTTGIISGTPTQVTALSTYTITAYNEGGHSTTTVDIEIKDQVGPGLAPPNISYVTPQVYTPNATIPALLPTNTGGSVPPNIYGQVFTFAGNGQKGVIDGDKTTAGFSFPNYPVVAPDGTVYITDNNRLIRQITPGGNVTTIAGSNIGYQDGAGLSAEFNAPAAMVIGTDGSIYVVDSNNGKIRKVTGGRNVSTFADGFRQPNGIAIDAAGNLYVSEYAGNTVKKVTPGGTVSTLAGTDGVAGNADGTGAAASFRGPSYMAIDVSGNIFLADYNNNTIRKITPAGVVTTFAGSGVKGRQDGQGAAASFNGPEGIAFGEDGSLYVSDAGNNLIRKITPDGTVTTFAGNGNAGYKDGFGINTSFNFPHGLAINVDGNMLVTDLQNNLVREIITTGFTIDKDLPPGLTFDAKTGTISGTPTSLWPATQYKITGINGAGSSTTILTIEVKRGSSPGGPVISYQSPQTYNINQTITPLTPTSSGSAVPVITFGQSLTFSGKGPPGTTDGDAITASYHGPSGVAVDAAGNVYVADYLNNLIRKISPAGISSTFAGSGDNGLSNGTGASAVFNKPASIAIDAAGNLYVADADNDVIRKITPAGVVTTFAGIGSAGSANGPGISASFNLPQGIAIDAAGNLYVADTFNHLIRKITPAGIVSTLAGSGAPGSNNGNGTNASFNLPQNLTVDAAGNVFVTDLSNNVIRKITPAGDVSTYAGRGSAGSNNGPALSASFNQPSGIVVDDIGDLFISDYGGNIIRMIDPAGNVSTLAGSGVAGSLNNTGIVATFAGPKGLALDANRKLYIADYLNNEIRTVYTLGYTIDKPLPPGMVFDGTTGTISGKPNVLSPLTTYTITAYNIYGSSTAKVDIKVVDSQTITFPPIPDKSVCDIDFDPGATSSSPITYTSSDLTVATIVSGKVHIVGAGTTTITADDGISKYPQTLTVTAALVSSVTISPVPSADACALALVTYTATPVNGGTTPHYQWKVNGQDTGADNQTFTSTTLNNNDKITCVLTSSLPCVTGTTATSNEATVVLDAPVTTSVTIASSLTGPVCAGTEIMFTATPALPALSPDYQWKVNGANAGTNSSTFIIKTLADDDIVTCVITSDGKCLANPTATSNAITVTFNPVSQCIIVVPNTFTPNGDGINDLWNITALSYYPDCTVTVFSRYGSVVYRSTGYGKPWDGATNGGSLPVGTYYYILDLKNGKKPMSGSVTILR